MKKCCDEFEKWIHDDMIEFKGWYDDSDFVKINYCPFCGTKLK